LLSFAQLDVSARRSGTDGGYLRTLRVWTVHG
jgi:hypothetical protein